MTSQETTSKMYRITLTKLKNGVTEETACYLLEHLDRIEQRIPKQVVIFDAKYAHFEETVDAHRLLEDCKSLRKLGGKRMPKLLQ